MSTDQKIVDLACRRVRPTDIAYNLGVNVDKVYAVIRRARTSGVKIAHFKTISRRLPEVPPALDGHVKIPLPLLKLLRSDAERRGQTLSETATRLLEVGLLGGGARNA